MTGFEPVVRDNPYSFADCHLRPLESHGQIKNPSYILDWGLMLLLDFKFIT